MSQHTHVDLFPLQLYMARVSLGKVDKSLLTASKKHSIQTLLCLLGKKAIISLNLPTMLGIIILQETSLLCRLRTDPCQCKSTNRQNPPIQQKMSYILPNVVIFMLFEV